MRREGRTRGSSTTAAGQAPIREPERRFLRRPLCHCDVLTTVAWGLGVRLETRLVLQGVVLLSRFGRAAGRLLVPQTAGGEGGQLGGGGGVWFANL